MSERKRPRRQASQHAYKNRTSQSLELEISLFRLLCESPGIIFSGAGMSASAGLDIFSTVAPQPGKRSIDSKSRHRGIYSQAAKTLGIKDGMQAFRYRFLQNHPVECFQLLSSLYHQASDVSPTLSHQILASMDDQLLRHYTLNIDGLATIAAGQAIEKIVELHGSLRQLVCRLCGWVYETKTILRSQSNTKSNPTTVPTCSHCQGQLRFRILMYDDTESHLIHQSTNPLETMLLPNDLELAQWIVWVGVSFRQQASCEYFTKVLAAKCPIVVVDPRAGEVVEDLETAVGSLDGLVHPIVMDSDDFFRKVQEYKQNIHNGNIPPT